MSSAVTPDNSVSPSKSKIAYRFLKERMTGLEYTAGYRLVLSSVARELDMSVVPVREAIRQLEAEGLVTFVHNVGAQVSMVNDAEYRHSMQALAVLEGAATALAACELTADDLRLARSVNDEMIRSLDSFDPGRFTTLNHRFHSVLFGRCVNPHLTSLVEAEWTRLGHVRFSTFAFVPGRAHESVREHEHIVRLIETGAPLADIEGAARQHRSATLDAYLLEQNVRAEQQP